jgi:hypothetical protein
MRYIKAILIIRILTEFVLGQSVTKTMNRLPDTGQNTSYTNIFGEDNDYNINVPFFILNGDGTVTDTITGLMWQQSDGGEMRYDQALIYCDSLTLGGFNNWRLPSAHEAFSIVNLQNTNPALDTKVFTNTGAEYWWTADKQVSDTNKVWVTNSGGGIGNHLKTETISAGGNKKFHVKAVRIINFPQVIESHFTDNGNGTITDNLTNLIWQKSPYIDTITWESALTYADTLKLAGYTDWRLPNIKELQSINDEKLVNPSINKIYFDVTAAKKYWSSTTLPNQVTKAWYLNTQFGITTYDTKTIKHNLICVRNNQISTMLPEITSHKVWVHPNPFTTSINIQNLNGNESFELINQVGQVIYSGKMIQQEDFSSIQQGIYFLKIKGINVSIIKIIKE